MDEANPAGLTGHVAWEGGGSADLAKLDGEAVELLSTRPFAPGSRPEGKLSRGGRYRMKVHRSRRIGGDEPPRYRIEGRLLDVTRAERESLRALLDGSAPEGSS